MNFPNTVLALVLSGSLVALASVATAAETLVHCSQGAPAGFDPALHTDATTFEASSRPLHDRLVEHTPGSLEIRPGLAELWEVSENGREVVFHLRKGVKFHTTPYFTPTRDFNADDVLFSLRRQLKSDHPWHGYWRGSGWEFFDGMGMRALVRDITKIDDYTVKLTLRRPAAPVLANLAMDFGSIVSAEYAELLEAAGTRQKLNQEPIGTGPFAFVGYQEGTLIRYSAHADYWGGAPSVANLMFSITPDAEVRFQELRAGECHVMSHPLPGDIKRIREDADLVLAEQLALDVGYLAFNTRSAPFNKPQVRQALNHAIHKQAILETVFEGAGRVATGPISPSMWAQAPQDETDLYFPELAEELLRAAGVETLSLNIWAMPVQRAYNPNARRMAELLQTGFANIGVDVEIVSYPWGEYLSRSRNTKRDGAVLLGWTGGNGDPDSVLSALLSCDNVGVSNRAHWCNKEFDTLLEKARSTYDTAERMQLYEKALAIVRDDVPLVPIAHSSVFAAMTSNVSGVTLDPMGRLNFGVASIAE